ncbi:MAG: glutamyl-tRNA amidotransferase [Opitutaceae bacterium]|nr:glutamyl-tRNA amidotransferase [Opitutaceae bacterium]|tara:strand:- start:2113 stop:2562 length:450 start_codon:yes stop_codon:yes gene_type:complete
MATTYETLRADIIVAMKARDSATATILRTADAAIQRSSMDLNKDIDEALVIATLRKSVKNLKDANSEFAKGGRDDLIAANDAEITILNKYLPQEIEGAKLEALVDQALADTGAQTRKEMGKVIGALKKYPEADLINFGSASKLIQSKLS